MSVVYLGKQEFSSVYDAYYDRIYKYAYTILLNKEDAEDVTEDTFMAAYMSYEHYDETKASVVTWLTRIAHNRAVNLVRSAAYAKRVDLPDTWEIADEEDFTERLGSTDAVLGLYAHLMPGDREFLNLRYVMELKDGEIAELLHLNTKTVSKRYQRLLKRCREILGGQEDGRQ